MIFHPFYPESINRFIYSSLINGNVGVDVFFFLSAYGLCFSLNKSDNIAQFYKKRIKRLFPLYLFFLILVCLLFRQDICLYRNVLDCFYHICGFATINAFQSDIEWYIPSLICLYLLFPFLYKCLLKISSRFWCIILLLILLVLVCPAFKILIQQRLAYRLPIIMMGVITAIIGKSGGGKLCTLYIVFAFLGFLVENTIIRNAAIIPLIICNFNDIKISDYILNPLKFIGKYTLEIYLAQVVTTAYFMRTYGNYLDPKLLIIITIVLTVVLSYLFYFIQNRFSFIRILRK